MTDPYKIAVLTALGERGRYEITLRKLHEALKDEPDDAIRGYLHGATAYLSAWLDIERRNRTEENFGVDQALEYLAAGGIAIMQRGLARLEKRDLERAETGSLPN